MVKNKNPKGMDKSLRIGGYGRLRECYLTPEWMEDFTNEIDDRGKFIQFYELEMEEGGHIFGGSLTGRMFEYENVFVVMWYCGEYTDCGVFRKKKSEEEENE